MLLFDITKLCNNKKAEKIMSFNISESAGLSFTTNSKFNQKNFMIIALRFLYS